MKHATYYKRNWGRDEGAAKSTGVGVKATSRLYNPGDVPPSTHSNGVQGYDFMEYNIGGHTVCSDENKFGLKAWSIGCLSLKPSIEKLNSLYSNV